MNLDSQVLHPQGENRILDFGATAASHSASSYSQNSTSAIFCSTGSKHDSVANPLTINLLTEDIGEVLKQVQSDVKLHFSSREESKPKKKLTARSQRHKLFSESIPIDDIPLPTNLPRAEAGNLFNSKDSILFRVKATYGKQKIRFTLHPRWGFLDLQREIAGQLGIDDFCTIDLKCLDDGHEWILLTCDADLKECIDVYRMSSQGHTIRISLHRELKPGLDHSLGSQVQSQIHHRFL